MSTTKKEPEALEKVTLISPGGHKYELSVSDHGILNVTLKKDVEAPAEGSES